MNIFAHYPTQLNTTEQSTTQRKNNTQHTHFYRFSALPAHSLGGGARWRLRGCSGAVGPNLHDASCRSWDVKHRCVDGNIRVTTTNQTTMRYDLHAVGRLGRTEKGTCHGTHHESCSPICKAAVKDAHHSKTRRCNRCIQCWPRAASIGGLPSQWKSSQILPTPTADGRM